MSMLRSETVSGKTTATAKAKTVQRIPLTNDGLDFPCVINERFGEFERSANFLGTEN